MIINVGRQLGSGGRTIAARLAERFGCRFYDRELLNLAAKESGFCEEFFERNDESKNFFKSVFHLHVPHMSDGSFYNNGLSQESLFKFQSDAIRKAAETGACVFVGRCADYVLRDRDDMINIFITANEDDRIKRIRERSGCEEAEAHKRISKGDSERASYYNYYTGKKWGHSESYDLCVNSSILGIDATVDYIAGFIERAMPAGDNTERK